mgnify:CR=1 FL=1
MEKKVRARTSKDFVQKQGQAQDRRKATQGHFKDLRKAAAAEGKCIFTIGELSNYMKKAETSRMCVCLNSGCF